MRSLILAALAAAIAAPALGQTPAAPSIANGARLYDKWCGTCHGPGIGNPGNKVKPGVDALAAKYPGTSGLLTDRADLTPEYVELFVRNGVSIMPFFRRSELTDKELRDVGEYLSQKNKER